MKLHVDPALCQGHNRCIATASHLFTIDEEGYASVAGDGQIRAAQLAAAELAVDNCPEQAISLVADS
jgi:ferredoxin